MNLVECQQQYDTLGKTIESEIDLRGKRLENALAPQPSMQYAWGTLSAELAGLYKDADNAVDIAFGKAYTVAQSDNYKSVNSTDAKWAAQADDDYNTAVTRKNKIYRLKKKVDSVCDSIESRKYVLKDLTASIISQVNNARLD